MQIAVQGFVHRPGSYLYGQEDRAYHRNDRPGTETKGAVDKDPVKVLQEYQCKPAIEGLLFPSLKQACKLPGQDSVYKHQRQRQRRLK